MSEAIKKTGSFFILSTYVTSLAIAVTVFGGNMIKGAYESGIKHEERIANIQDTSTNIQDQMGELFHFHYETQLQVKAHDVLIKKCEADINDCETHIFLFHKGVQE